MSFFNPKLQPYNPSESEPTVETEIEAVNDAVFEPNFEKRKVDLFKRRKAHEIALRLGFRDLKIDSEILVNLKKEMSGLGIQEEEYVAFCKNYPSQEN